MSLLFYHKTFYLTAFLCAFNSSLFGYCHFSAGTRFDTAVRRDVGMPVLENITDEEGDKELAGESREMTPMQTKLKVPRK